jgi:hypothetical protein
MKKASSKTSIGPSAASLRDMPEIDFTKVRVHRNPYAAVIAAEGSSLIHDEPSSRSLADVPEVDFSRVKSRTNPYADELLRLRAGRGRPRKGQEIGPTPARSIRLPTSLWTALEDAARDANTTVHALLRLAVAHLLESDGFKRDRRSIGGARRRRGARGPKPGPTRGSAAAARPRRRAGRAHRRA